MLTKKCKMKYELDVNFVLINNKLFFGILNKIYVVVLPFFYFYLLEKNKIFLLFNSKYFYKSVLNFIINILYNAFTVFFFRLRLKGLGYKIKKYLGNFYRFFFGFKHFYYLFVPSNLLFKLKGRKFIVLSNNLVSLNNFFNQLLLLKKLDYYERNNTFVRPNKILYIKKFK